MTFKEEVQHRPKQYNIATTSDDNQEEETEKFGLELLQHHPLPVSFTKTRQPRTTVQCPLSRTKAHLDTGMTSDSVCCLIDPASVCMQVSFSLLS